MLSNILRPAQKLPRLIENRLLKSPLFLSAFFSRNERQSIRSGYGFDLFCPLFVVSGENSTCFVAQTNRGKLLIKRYNDYASRFLAEHRVLEFLAKQNFPAPRLVKTLEGSTYLRAADQVYAAYHFIPGQRLLRSPSASHSLQEQITTGGALLGRLDKVLYSLKAEQEPDVIRKRLCMFPTTIEEILQYLDVYLNRLSLRHFKSARVKHILSARSDLYSLAAELETPLQSYQRCLAKQTIHYDYTPKNTVVSDDGTNAHVIDFGEVRHDLRAAEVSRGLLAFAHHRETGLNIEAANAFLQAYRSNYDFSHDELEAVPMLAQWRQLRSIAMIAKHANSDSCADSHVEYRANPEIHISGRLSTLNAIIKYLPKLQRFCSGERAFDMVNPDFPLTIQRDVHGANPQNFSP